MRLQWPRHKKYKKYVSLKSYKARFNLEDSQ